MIEWRPYQREAIDSFLTSYNKREESGLICLPTGSGKTLVASGCLEMVMRRTGGFKALWCAHRIELLKQAADALSTVGLKASMYESEQPEVLLSMVQSQHKIVDTNYNVVVIDEAHHQSAPTYQALRDRVNTSYYLGLTATPSRLDGKDLGFNKLLASKSMLELVEQGYLSPAKYFRALTNLGYQMTIRGGDFSRTSLNQLNEEHRNRFVIGTVADSKWGATLVYAVNLDHARAISEGLIEAGVDARSVSGETKDQEREQIHEWFMSAERPVLINCELYTEGMDLPRVETVALARPTASESLFCQMVGRGCRLYKGKDHFNILDFVDMSTKYATLSSSWIEDVGASAGDETTEDLLEESRDTAVIEQATEVLREVASQNNITNTKAYREARLEPLEFVGFLKHGSRFWKRHKVFAITDSQYLALRKMASVIYDAYRGPVRPNPHNLVSSSYALGCTNGEFPRSQWEPMAWAYIAFIHGQQEYGDNNMVWQWIPTKDIDQEAMQRRVVTEVSEAEAKRIEKNNKYREVVVLQDEYVRYAERYKPYILPVISIFRPVGYADSILRVDYDGSFSDNIKFAREAFEELLEEVTGSYVSVKVNYLREEVCGRYRR